MVAEVAEYEVEEAEYREGAQSILFRARLLGLVELRVFDLLSTRLMIFRLLDR
jgi:hypothetical protein